MIAALRRAAVLLLIGAVAGACGSSPPPPPHKATPAPSAPPGPTLTGRILAFSAADRRVVQISGSAAQATTVATDVLAADLSPDGRNPRLRLAVPDDRAA